MLQCLGWIFLVIVDKDIFYDINTTACEADGKDTTVVSQYKNCFPNV